MVGPLVGVLSVLMLIGVCALVHGVQILIKSADSASWPSTDGIVKTAEMEGNLGKSRMTSRQSDIRLSSQWKATDRQQNTNGTGQQFKRVGCPRRPEQYRVGRKVKVFYSPTDTADCLLEPGIHPSSWFWALLGGAFTGVPLILMLLALVYGVRVPARRKGKG